MYCSLFLIWHIWSHLSVPRLCISLSFPHLSLLCHLWALLNSISSNNIIISLFLHFFPIIRNRLLVSNDSHTLASIQSIVSNLGLEWEVSYLCKINIFHLHQFLNSFKSIFKCNFSLLSYISLLSHHKRFILR